MIPSLLLSLQLSVALFVATPLFSMNKDQELTQDNPGPTVLPDSDDEEIQKLD
jgi:hypothetical protein